MSPQLFWLHDEVLSEALIEAQGTECCTFLFVFDTVWLRQRPVSLKRIQFIYETLLALPVAIEIVYGRCRRGAETEGSRTSRTGL